MEKAGQVLRTAAHACLADDMVFEGLFETYRSAVARPLARQLGAYELGESAFHS